MYTYDRRGRMSELGKEFPMYEFEEGISEEDVLWKPDIRESKDEHTQRQQTAFDIIFHPNNIEHTCECWISVFVCDGVAVRCPEDLN